MTVDTTHWSKNKKDCFYIPRFKLAIRESQFADRIYLFADRFKHFFVKFTNQHFPSARIFVMRETTKFLFTLQACHISWYLKL